MTTKLTAKLAITILILGSLFGFAETTSSADKTKSAETKLSAKPEEVPQPKTSAKVADAHTAAKPTVPAPEPKTGGRTSAPKVEERDILKVEKPEEKYSDLAKALDEKIEFKWMNLKGDANDFNVGGEKKILKEAITALEAYRKLVTKEDCEKNEATQSFVKLMDAYVAEIHRALTVPEEEKVTNGVADRARIEKALKVNAKVIIAFSRELRELLKKKAEVQKEKKDVFDGQDDVLGKALNWIEGALMGKMENKPAPATLGKDVEELEAKFTVDDAAKDDATKSIVAAGKTASEQIKAEEVCKLEEPTPAHQSGAGPAGNAGTAGGQAPVDPNAAKIADLEKRLKEAEERARIEKESREAAEKAARSGAGAPFDGQDLKLPGLFDEDLLSKLLQTVDAAGRPNEGARTGGSPSPDNSRSFSIPPLSVGSDQGSQSAPIQPPPMPQYIPPQDMTPMLMALANQQQQNRPVGEVVKPSTTPPPQPPQVIPNPQNAQNAQLSATLAAILSRLGPNGTMQGQTGLAVTNLGALRNRVPRGGSFLRNRTLSRGRSAGTASSTARGRTRAPARLGR